VAYTKDITGPKAALIRELDPDFNEIIP